MTGRFLLPVLVCGVSLAAAVAGVAAQSEPQAVKGLEISVASVTRASNVSLGDCPPGENSVRGVIRPGDTESEYATVTLDITVLPDFDAAAIIRPPQATDGDGNTYRTAQAFTGTGDPTMYSCEFSFRIPKGTELTQITIEDATFDLEM